MPEPASPGVLEQWVAAASDVMWGPWMVALLFGTHLFLTLRLGFVQRFLGRGIRISLQRSEGTWYLVRLPSGIGGWVRAKDLEKI